GTDRARPLARRPVRPGAAVASHPLNVGRAMLTSLRILARAAQQWSANGDTRLGAALAYYALFSIVPLLVIAIYIAGVFYGDEAAQGTVKNCLRTSRDRASAAAIESHLDSAGQTAGVPGASLLSVGVLVFGALGAFVHLRTSLCLIWKLEPPHTNTV